MSLGEDIWEEFSTPFYFTPVVRQERRKGTLWINVHGGAGGFGVKF